MPAKDKFHDVVKVAMLRRVKHLGIKSPIFSMLCRPNASPLHLTRNDILVYFTTYLLRRQFPKNSCYTESLKIR
jgi:hypothetical protein